MRPRRAAVLLAAAVLVAGGSAGCAGDPVADYCETLADEQAALREAIGGGGTGALLAAVDTLRRLEEAAPGQLQDEWTLVVDRVEDLRGALADADVDPASYDPASPPEGLSTQQREAITDAAVGLAEPATLQAVASIEQQALDVCGTPIGI